MIYLCRIFLSIFLLAVFSSCVNKRNVVTQSDQAQFDFPEALAHGAIEKVVDDIFVVQGTHFFVHDGTRIQTSRTMTIIRENGELSLINSIRLNEHGLNELKKLGRVKNVIRLGAFHGRDDAFYQRHLGAQLWAFSNMEFSHGEVVDHDLNRGVLPFGQAKVIAFTTIRHPEAVLLIEKAGGVLITCDSIKNWQEKDSYFDDDTFASMQSAGAIGEANIDTVWLSAIQPSNTDLASIGELDFSIVITAHGKPLILDAKQKVLSSIKKALR